jgi:hypothetical protein
MNAPPRSRLVVQPAPMVWRWRDQWPGHTDPTLQPPLPQARPARAPAGGGDDEGTLAVARLWAQTITETLAGRRNPLHLEAWFDIAQLRALIRAAQACRGAGAVRLSGLRTQRPADGVIEAAMTLVVPPHVRAVAFTLVSAHGRWQCAGLTLGC